MRILECSGWFLCGCTGQSQQNSSPGVIPGHKMWLTFLLPCKMWSNLQNFADKKRFIVYYQYCNDVWSTGHTKVIFYHTDSFLFFSMWPIFTFCMWKSFTLTRNPASHSFLIKWLEFAHEKFTEQQKMWLHLKPIWSFCCCWPVLSPIKQTSKVRIFKKALVFAIASTN